MYYLQEIEDIIDHNIFAIRMSLSMLDRSWITFGDWERDIPEGG